MPIDSADAILTRCLTPASVRRAAQIFGEKDPPEPAPWTASDCFSDCADKAYGAMAGWCDWHEMRAKARRITGPSVVALAALRDAADGMTEVIHQQLCNEDLFTQCEALHEAVSDVKALAEDARRVGSKQDWQNTDEHAEEIETSYLRGWAWEFSNIVWCVTHARAEPDRDFYYACLAAHSLATTELPRCPAGSAV